MYSYEDCRETVSYKVSDGVHGNKVVRSIHVILDGVCIGRIRELIPEDNGNHWGKKENDKFIIEPCGPKFRFVYNAVGYAPSVLLAKKVAEEKLYNAYLDYCEREARYDILKTRELPKLPPAALTYGDNADFYPTPPAVAGKMLSHVQWTEKIGDTYAHGIIESILEPSAGKGDLLDALLAFAGDHKYDFDFNYRAKKPKWGKSQEETIIVSLCIPEPPARSRILEYMQKAKNYTGENEPTALALAGNWVASLVQQYNFECEFGVKFLREYQGYANYVSPDKTGGGPIITVNINDRHKTSSVSTETINEYLRSVRKKFWSKLMYDPELEKVVGKLTSDMRNEYWGKVNSMGDYEFSKFNIKALILDMQAQLNQGLKSAILGLFETLSSKFTWYPASENNRHYYTGWATNKAHKVGMRSIIPMNGFAASFSSKNLDTGRIYAELSDLEKVMDFLDRGQTQSINRYKMSSFIDYAEAHGQTSVETTYFIATFYKKGTCHIKFRDSARHIVDRLNIFAAMNKNWLPPYYGKVRYEDMDEEGKQVVDSFHAETCPSGKKSESYKLPAYEEIVKDPGAYLTTIDEKNTPLLLGA